MSWKERLGELLESGTIMTVLWIAGTYAIIWLIIHIFQVPNPYALPHLPWYVSLIPYFIMSTIFTIFFSYALAEWPMLAPGTRVVGCPFLISASVSSSLYLLPISFLVWWQSLIAFVVYIIVVGLGVK